MTSAAAKLDEGLIYLGHSDPEQGGGDECLMLRLANRHGLVTGATGTGKTVTLQVLAEGFSAAGVPVFAADIKGDLSGISAKPASRRPCLAKRAEEIGLDDCDATPPSPSCSGTCSASRAIPSAPPCRTWGRCCSRACSSSTRRRKACSTSCSAWRRTRSMPLLDLKDLRAMVDEIGAARQGADDQVRQRRRRPRSGAVQRRLLVLEEQGADNFFGEPALDINDFIRTAPRRPRRHQHPRRRQADEHAAPLRDVPAVDAGAAVRQAARGRRSRQAEARVLLRRGASAVQRGAQGAARAGRARHAPDPLEGRRRLLRDAEPARRARTPSRPSSATASSTRCAPSRRSSRRASAPPPRPSGPTRRSTSSASSRS